MRIFFVLFLFFCGGERGEGMNWWLCIVVRYTNDGVFCVRGVFHSWEKTH